MQFSPKEYILSLLLFFISILPSRAQAIMTTTGNWNVATNWSGSTIGNSISQTVTINSSINPTIAGTDNYTVGAVTLTQNNTLTINSGGILTIGASGNLKSLTTNDNTTLSISGTLVIWGDLIINKNITITIPVGGSLIVHGNVTMGTGSSNSNMNVSGTMTVDGNFTGNGNNDTTIAGSGKITIKGNLNVPSGNLNGPAGSFVVLGSCSGTYCHSSTLPIQLVSFEATPSADNIALQWKTVSEVNFNYFKIERSEDGEHFVSVDTVKGHGTTLAGYNYDWNDSRPIIGKNYYRLVTVDYDNTSEAFSIVMATFIGPKTFFIAPNPGNGEQVNAVVNFSTDNPAVITIYDSMGNGVGSFESSGLKSTISFSRPLSSGVYYAHFVSHDFTNVSRFIVR